MSKEKKSKGGKTTDTGKKSKPTDNKPIDKELNDRELDGVTGGTQLVGFGSFGIAKRS